MSCGGSKPGYGSASLLCFSRPTLIAADSSLMTDIKATALLKLVYLEMVGYDMSWASFHVLEVMSSPKYHQKRVGYLGAVQSFRPDTEVLMLATNLLKKARQGRRLDGGTAANLRRYRILVLPHRLSYLSLSRPSRMSLRHP